MKPLGRVSSLFVPRASRADPSQIEQLEQFLSERRRLVAITGAGVSTESGIPDYRSEGVGLYARTTRRPMTYQEFMSSPEKRQKYWARNYVGHDNFTSVRPNQTHRFFADFERRRAGPLHWLVTQNVDNLHLAAGSRRLTELHGNAHRVVCVRCKTISSRKVLQARLTESNPGFLSEAIVDVAPDGDAVVDDDVTKRFVVPACLTCGGDLKPDVVFFGDNVSKHKVEFVYKKTDECDGLFVVGSSLEVYSAFRFVSAAARLGKPIAILNIGKTRGDRMAQLKVEGVCSEILSLIKM